MATAGSIVVDLLMRTGAFETDAQRASKTAQKRFKEIERSASDAAKNMGGAFKGVLTGAIFGIGAASIFGKFVSETKEAQNEQSQLAAAVKSTGEAAGYSVKQLNAMASDFAGFFSEGEINKAQTRLLSYTGVVGEQYPRALRAAMDMAARLGMSFEGSAETIGKALDVPSAGLTALSRQGFRFTEEQKKLVESLEASGRTAEAQGIILSALESAYGGAAQAARDNFGGALTALENQIGSLMTGDDSSVNGLTSAINELTDSLGSEETKQSFSAFTQFLAETATGVVNLANEFAIGIRMADGFVNSLLTFGTINPFNSPQENVEKYTAQLAEAVAWRDRLLAEGDSAAADTVSKKVQQLQNQLDFSRRQLNKNEADVFAAYRNVGETGDSGIVTMDGITVTPPGPKKPKTKEQIDAGQKLIDQMNERIALIGKETEYEKLLARTAVGSVKFRDADQKAQALSRAQVFDALSELNKAYDDAAIKPQELPVAFAAATDQITEFSTQAARDIQSTLGSTLYETLSGNFTNIGKSFSNMLLKMAADLGASQLNKALFGGFGSGGSNAIGGIFGAIGGALGFGPKYTAAGGTIGGNAMGDLSGLSLPTKQFSSGGFTGVGGKYEAAGIVHKGEYVMDAESTSRLGVPFLNRLRGYSSGGEVGASAATGALPGGGVTVNLIGGPKNPEVRQSRDANGGLQIDVIYDQFVDRLASGVASGASRFNQAIERRYALAPQMG